jgi:uncharacterized protein (DUF952 family)
MKSDLIFHVVSRRKWHGLNKHGIYTPEIFEDTGRVECVEAQELSNYLNREFSGRKNLIILVIDKSRLSNAYQNKPETGRVLVEKGINLDAILDKIRIDCEPDGSFDVEFKAN